ncbi:hypothetical protein THASP1DRAFT_32825, partial [Thamnocephalis sphaerospora]
MSTFRKQNGSTGGRQSGGVAEQRLTLFQAKQYAAALQLFDQCIALEPRSVTVRDQRAATHEKLGNIKAALADGKAMLTLAPRCALGYLRVAKCFQLSGRLPMAIQIYEAGLSSVPTDDAWRPAKIAGMSKTRSSKCERIVKKGSAPGLDAVSACRVALGCAGTLTDSTAKADMISDSDSIRVRSRPITNAHVQQALAMCRERLRVLRLPPSPALSSNALRALASSRSRWLESLELTPNARISEASFIAVLDRVGGTLRTLTLHAYGDWARHAWPRCRALRRLEAHHANGLTVLTGGASATLEELHLPHCVHLFGQKIAELVTGFPALRVLALPDAATGATLSALLHLRHLPHLETIQLPGLRAPQEATVDDIAMAFVND